MDPVELTYSGNSFPCILERVSGAINLLLREAEIAEAMEGMLSSFIKESVKALSTGGEKWGSFFLSRFNACNLGPAAFYIEFCPTGKECSDYGYKPGYVQVRIAAGDFLKKEISFVKPDGFTEICYLAEVFKLLEEIFIKFGFTIKGKGE